MGWIHSISIEYSGYQWPVYSLSFSPCEKPWFHSHQKFALPASQQQGRRRDAQGEGLVTPGTFHLPSGYLT